MSAIEEPAPMGSISGAPARRQLAITPDNDADLPVICRSIEALSDGTLKIVAVDDTRVENDVVITDVSKAVQRNVVEGQIIPVATRRVMVPTGSPATVIGLVGG
ncbi:MAG: spike base protein, RCAP_Rcc01079 family [Gemmatimonas sp.]